MDAAGRMGRGTRQARRMCGLKRRALVSFACVALFVFLALSSLATREDRTGDARLTRAPRLRAHRGDGGTVEGDAWLAEWQRAHGVDARGAHGARAEMLDVREPMSSSSRTPPKAHHVVAAGKHHNKRYSLRGSLEASLPLDSDIGSASEEDPALSAALRSMRLTPGSLVALTFADAKMLAMVLNWSAHLRRANVPRLVGALDDHTEKALVARDVPTFRVFQKSGLDGSAAHASDSWKRFAATRIAKVRATLELGYDVLMSDADVVWLSDPTHYLQCPEFAVESTVPQSNPLPCASIAAADVMVSSDNLSPKTDAKRGALYARGGVFNTGVVFLKTTPGAKAFAKAWSRLLTLDSENGEVSENDARFARLTSDQQVFNAMTRRENEWPGLDPVDHHTEVPGDVSVPTRVLEAGLGLPLDDASANVDGFRAFKLGVLPVAAFQPGHVAFLQRVDEMSATDLANVFGEATDADASKKQTNDERPNARRRNEPFCVHATYTFDGSTAEAKRFRFAEHGLWDPESDSETMDDFSGRKFLTYDPGSVLETVFGVPFETLKSWAPDIGTHLRAGTAQIRALRDAIAVARVLNRTLAVPAPFCFCDKVWGGHDNIFTFNCHYPGSADSGHVPGTCPLDHFVSPSAMRGAGVDFVALGELPFVLEKSNTVLEVVSGADSRRDIRHEDEDVIVAKPQKSRVKKNAVSIPAFATETQIRDALERRGAGLRDARLVRLSNALDAFGGFDDESRTRTFEATLVRDALRPQEWCSECHPRGCANLIDEATLALGSLRVVREVHDQFCASFEAPTGFQATRGLRDGETTAAKAKKKKKTTRASRLARLHDADGDDVVGTPGTPPVDDEIAAAGWRRT